MTLFSRWGCLGVVLASLTAGSAAAADLTIVVTNVSEAKGQIRIAIFDNAQGWPSGEPKLAAVMVPAVAPEVRVTLHDMPMTGVAISAFQDLDRDGVLGTGFLGVPDEPYSFSRGEKSFGQAMIEIPSEGTQVTLQLID